MIDIKKYEKAIKKSGHKIKDISYVKEELYTDFISPHRSKVQEVRLEPLCSDIEIHFMDGMCLYISVITDFYY